MLRKLLSQVKQYKLSTILTPIFAAMEVVMESLIPLATAALIDKGISAGSMQETVHYGVVMACLAMLSLLFGVLAAQTAAKSSTGFACNLRHTMYSAIQNFSFSNIDKFSTAGLITRMTTDVTNVQNAFQMTLRMAVRAPFTLLCSLFMVMTINLRISVVFIGVCVLIAIPLLMMMGYMGKKFAEVFKQYDALNTSVQENVAGIRVVKAFAREDYENKKFGKAAEKVYSLFVKAQKTMAMMDPVSMIVMYACILLLSWFGAKMIVSSVLTTGELTSLLSYAMSILMSVMMVSMIFVQISMSSASGKRIVEVMDEKPDITDPENPVEEVKDGSIDFQDVCFTYHKEGSGENVLKNVNLHINSGETIGIIGGTGCGKSTLVSLISRLYDATEGEVKVGGENVKNYSTKVLRDQVSVVLQKNVLFSGTVLENLRWGNEKATEEECREACTLACADEFVEAMPEKYNTHVEQGGSNFSGGQKQRLCIARALLKKPKVLILDDSTSAVDTATDAKIRRSFAEKIPGTTKIIISQRINSVKDADRIIVIEDGAISGFAPHEELLETNELYRDIYDTQTNGGGDFDEPGAEEKGGDRR